MTAPEPSPVARWPRSALIVLLVCGAVYWPRLGVRGLASTEGHRVIPAWEMLESGDWLVPRLFGQIYVRKTPGIHWAVALSSSLLGQTEFAARAVGAASATAMALLALLFATRWFGRPWGLAAGLTQALLPIMWAYGRSAEIEPLNYFGTQAAVFLLLELLIPAQRRTRAAAAGLAVLAGLAITFMAAAKGPTGVPCLVAATLAACAVTRSARPLARPALWAAALIPTVLVGGVTMLMVRALLAAGEPAVTQSIAYGLWDLERLNLDRVLRVLSLSPLALVWGLPLSLVLLFPWGDAARREEQADGQDGHSRSFLLARALGLACLISLLLFTLGGVDNPRHAMPAIALTAPLAAYVLRGAAGDFTPRRQRLARLLMLGSPWTWPILLLVASQVWIWLLEPKLRAPSGREPGMALAQVIPDGSEVWADEIVNARPELLHYLRRAAAAQGKTVHPRWFMVSPDRPVLPAPGNFLLLRGYEEEPYRRAGLMDRLQPVTTGHVHKYLFTLYQVRPGAP